MSTAKQQADTARIWRAIGRLEGLNRKKMSVLAEPVIHIVI